MAIGKITIEAVKAIPVPPKGKRAHLWDNVLKGFGVMVTDKGARSYLVQYRMGGRGTETRRVTIGKHGSPWTPTTARVRAEDILQQARVGVDPFDAQRHELAAAKAAREAEARQHAVASSLAFDGIAQRYIDSIKGTRRTWKHVEADINRDLSPKFGGRSLLDLTADDLNEVVDGVEEARGQSAALRVYHAIRAVVGFAHVKHAKLFPKSKSPLPDLHRPNSVAKRERYLRDHELRLVWQAAGGMPAPFGSIVRLLILSGQRLREVASVPWTEIDLAKREWVIPGERTKNGVATLVPLSDAMVQIFEDAPKLAGADGPVFTTNGKTPFSGFSKAKVKLDAAIAAIIADEADDATPAAIEPWRLHDLRRSFAVGCQSLGVRSEVIEHLLNHKDRVRSGVAGVYQLFEYRDEKRSALDAWASHVGALAQPRPSNVVALRA